MSIAETTINTNKRTDTGEIIVTLFEWCDLSCIFCNQDHNSKVGIDTIRTKADIIVEAIEVLRTTRNKNNFSINIMGGEIFSDKLPDSLFEDYKYLVNYLKDYSAQTSTPIDVRFVTNFIWTKKERVHDLVNQTGCVLGTSYDPAGRFNADTFEIYKSNLQEFNNHIQGVNVVLTKQNIDKFLKEDVPFFDYIYNNFDVYFDHYTPEKNVNAVLPKDIDLKAIALYMYNNYPNSHPYVNYPSKERKQMTCMDTYTIMPDGRYGKCDILLTASRPENAIPVQVLEISSKAQLEEKWFEDYNCLECEHFMRCSLGCFLSNHINESRTQEECWMKEVYDYIDQKEGGL